MNSVTLVIKKANQLQYQKNYIVNVFVYFHDNRKILQTNFKHKLDRNINN
jgi:hypothetical protein